MTSSSSLSSASVLSYATEAALKKSASFAACSAVRTMVVKTVEGRWTAIIIGSGMEANAAWFSSARKDGLRFMWIAN